MANKSDLIRRPLLGLTKFVIEGSAEATKLAGAAIARSRARLSRAQMQAEQLEDREEPGRGPDDKPTDRERRDTPIQYGG
jgi:hypothetical protein